MNGLEKIINKITEDAKAKAEEYKKSADAQISAMKSEAVDSIMKSKEDFKVRAEKDSEDVIARAKSASESLYRNTVLQKKSEIIDLVFAKTEEKIRSMNKNEYVKFMRQALVYAVKERKRAKDEIARLYGEEEAELDSGYEVIFGKNDVKNGVSREIFNSAINSLPPEIKKVILSEKTADIDGGFILKCNDIEINCSVASMVEQARILCENEVIEKLF